MVTIQVFFLAYFFLFWITHFSTHFSSFSFTPFFHFILAAEDSGRSQEGLGLFLGERKNLDILQDMGNFSPLIYWLHSNSPMRSSSLCYFIYPFFALWLGKTAWLVTPGGPELQRKGNLVKVCWGITRLTLLIQPAGWYFIRENQHAYTCVIFKNHMAFQLYLLAKDIFWEKFFTSTSV